MRFGLSRLQLAGIAAVMIGATVSLSSCTAVVPTAIRLNADGAVDFASCQAVKNVTSATATTAFRNGPNHAINDATAKTVDLALSLDHLDTGQVIEFAGLPKKWDRVDVIVQGDAIALDGIGERNQITVGEWRWADQDSVIPGFPNRCDLKHD